MTSLSAHVVNLLLPLTGIKTFFAEPEKARQRIARMRARGPDLPPRAMLRDFAVDRDESRGYPVYTLLPREGPRPGAPHIVYYHGGGYLMEISVLHWKLVGKLCRELGASATVPLYPLAPEHTVDTVLPQMHALWSEVASAHGANTIIMMGDSAGAGMALAVAQRLAAADEPGPARLVLLSPWLDATGTHPMQPDIEKRDRMLAIAGLKGAGRMYAGDVPVTDPRVSPLFGSLVGLPPIQMFAGTHDILLPDARRLAERAQQEEGAPRIDYHEYPGMFHVWAILPVREAKAVRRQMLAFIRASG